MESAQLQGNSSPPRTLYGGCPHQHAMSQIPLTGSRINTWLISHNIQDVRVLARGMPIPMERLLLRGERFRGLPLQLAGSRMIVRGLEWFSHRTAGSNFTVAFYLCLSLHWMPLAVSRGLNRKAGENKWGRWESTLNNFLSWIQMNLF